MPRATLRRAASSLPPGRWGAGVSGGADSVALLRLLARRPDVRPVVLHLDHASRPESAADAGFVEGLAGRLGLPYVLRSIKDLQVAAGQRAAVRDGNEADWRAARFTFFAAATLAHDLRGVVLAHHADDVAETVALRLLRGSPRSGTAGLAPMRATSRVSGVEVRRPLLGVRRRRLRAFLRRIGQPWREDATNALPITPRNRLRAELDDAEVAALLDLAAAAGRAEAWLSGATPSWCDAVSATAAAALAGPLRRRGARAWLVRAGVPESRATPAAVDRLLAVLDPAGPRACGFAGGVRFERRGGVIRPAASPPAGPGPPAAPRRPSGGRP